MAKCDFANGHTSPSIPDPIRIRKSSGERPGQYWSGGPPGKPLGCCWLFVFDCAVLWVRGRVAKCDSANGHTSSNMPDPIRTRKSSGERPGQYWGGGPLGKPLGCCWLFVFGCVVLWVRGRVAKCDSANGHTSSNMPDPIRTRKSSGERPGQYWGGGPLGKPLGCCWLFVFGCAVFCYGCTEVSTRFLHRTTEKPRGKYSNLSPTIMLRRTYPIPSELGSQAAKGPVSTGVGDRPGSP